METHWLSISGRGEYLRTDSSLFTVMMYVCMMHLYECFKRSRLLISVLVLSVSCLCSVS